MGGTGIQCDVTVQERQIQMGENLVETREWSGGARAERSGEFDKARVWSAVSEMVELVT